MTPTDDARRLREALARLRRRAVLDRRTGAVLAGLTAAGMWVALAWSLGRAWQPLQSLPVLAGGAAATLVAALVAGLRRMPTLSWVARMADARFQQQERLATALEHGDATGVAFRAQLLAEAAGRAAALPARDAFPLRHHRPRGLAFIAAAALAAVAVLVARPHVDLAMQRADQASIAAAVQDLQRQAGAAARAAAAAPDDPRRKALAGALSAALGDVRRAQTPQSVLERLSELSDQLRGLADPGLAAEIQGAVAAAGALTGVDPLSPLARALGAGDLSGAAAAARALASSAGQLGAPARQSIAQALHAAAASAAQSGSALSTQLDAAATALQQGNAAGAKQALQSVAQQLDTLQQRQQDDRQLNAARDATGADQRQTAQRVDADRRAAGQTGQSGSAAAVVGGEGSGKAPSSQGASALGPAQGGAGEQGGPQPGGQPAGGSGGQGAGASGGGTRAAALGANEQVFVPGPPGAQVPDTSQAPVLLPGAAVPLSDARSVIAAFEQAALEALDRGEVAAGDRDLVRQYFSTLGGSS
ncbi:MAG TPA: hypothetical protein VGQ42_12975 [Candidatus Dormibacteraeota bacterium]|nr:hypothetical protein [Candidatus Dormibacteraeota bacterium]